MSADLIATNLTDVLSRLIAAGLSVQQVFPSQRTLKDGVVSIGDLPLSSAALKNTSYQTIYQEIEQNHAFHAKLIDGGLLIFQYKVTANGEILQHRLAYFPAPLLPTMEEAPALYENDELFADIVLERLVRFPIRFDFAPAQFIELQHPKSHLTLGQFEGCRIPVTGPIGPHAFMLFLVRNFYSRAYFRRRNIFEKKFKAINFPHSITDAERKISHLVII